MDFEFNYILHPVYVTALLNDIVFFLPIQPIEKVGDTKSMSKDVVLGGDVWDLLDELMIYMGNPMQYYEKDVKFVRVIFDSF